MGKCFGVIGAGAWGTALGVAVSRAGNKVTMVDTNQRVVDAIATTHTNPDYLPNVALPETMQASTDISEVIDQDIIMLVVPAQIARKVCEQLKALSLPQQTPIIIACKGVEQSTLKLMHEVVGEFLPNPIVILAGPNFALEVAQGKPSAATLASRDESLVKELVHIIGTPTFRTYYMTDIIGAQIGAAIKNVLAIACGIAEGKGFGENTKAALITRGMSEMIRLCLALGGRPRTLLGLCGVGDIMLTCGSRTSRNMNFGYELGAGASLDGLLAKGTTVEGYHTAKSAYALASKYEVEMPIVNAVYDVLYEGKSVDDVIQSLLSMPFGEEIVLD